MQPSPHKDVAALLSAVRACTECAAALPLGPRPIVQIDPAARLLIIGQAPARRVHLSGVPFDDPSGDRLRGWLGLSRAVFYSARIGLLPMGFCYPGRGGGGDNPPRKECAPLWHARLLAVMPEIRLTVLLGRHALAAYLPGPRGRSITEVARSAPEFLPRHLPLPHPSPRNTPWFARNPWFEAEVVPAARAAVAAALDP